MPELPYVYRLSTSDLQHQASCGIHLQEPIARKLQVQYYCNGCSNATIDAPPDGPPYLYDKVAECCSLRQHNICDGVKAPHTACQEGHLVWRVKSAGDSNDDQQTRSPMPSIPPLAQAAKVSVHHCTVVMSDGVVTSMLHYDWRTLFLIDH